MEGYRSSRSTSVCEAPSQSHDLNSYRPIHRKGKKLLAEKKRRARINNCLMQIRDIVCNGEEIKDTDIDKMEKAEILEKTLEVLTKLRHDYDDSRNSVSAHKAMAVRYASGFSSCAEESIRYIQCSRLIPAEVKHQLQAHLRSIARRIETSVHDAPLTYDLSYPSLPATPTSVSSLPVVHQEPSISSSLSLLLPVSSNTSSRLRISPPGRLNPQDMTQISAPGVSDIKPEPSDYKVNIPSPILSSTPVLRSENPEMAVINSVPQENQNNQQKFSPITAHDFASEHKENHPKDNSHFCVLSSYGHGRKIFSSQNNSTFYQCSPQSLTFTPSSSSSSKDQQNDVLYYSYQFSFPSAAPPSTSFSSSSSLPSSLPTVSSDLPISPHSQYSPISPANSPVSSICSTALVLPSSHSTSLLSEHQPIYQYNGYEPYPVLPIVVSAIPSSCATVFSETSTQPTSNISHSAPTSMANNALDLCAKRSDSHNISPETMWRPW